MTHHSFRIAPEYPDGRETIQVYFSNRWTNYKPSAEYEQTEFFVKALLHESLNLGCSLDRKIGTIVHTSDAGLKTVVLGIESHRCCSVLYTSQTNLNTGTERYVVYGIRYNMHSDYGIGICLEAVDIDKYYKNCGRKALKYI